MKESDVLWRVIELRERYEKQKTCPDCFKRLLEGGEADPPGGYGICKDTGCMAQENIDGWE